MILDITKLFKLDLDDIEKSNLSDDFITTCKENGINYFLKQKGPHPRTESIYIDEPINSYSKIINFESYFIEVENEEIAFYLKLKYNDIEIVERKI